MAATSPLTLYRCATPSAEKSSRKSFFLTTSSSPILETDYLNTKLKKIRTTIQRL